MFLRADFEDLGGYDQVGRALRDVVRKGRLVRVGRGLYARAVSAPSDGRLIPSKGFRALATEALSRLGIETASTRLEQADNAGRTTQVPSGRIVAVNKRVRRKIGYDGIYVGSSVLDRALVEWIASDLRSDASLVEKDWHVVRAIDVIASVDPAGMAPAFSSGTSLSKGWESHQAFFRGHRFQGR